MTKKAVPYLMIIIHILELTGKQDSVFVRAAGGGATDIAENQHIKAAVAAVSTAIFLRDRKQT